jgi:hypothetical protein
MKARGRRSARPDLVRARAAAIVTCAAFGAAHPTALQSHGWKCLGGEATRTGKRGGAREAGGPGAGFCRRRPRPPPPPRRPLRRARRRSRRAGGAALAQRAGSGPGSARGQHPGPRPTLPAVGPGALSRTAAPCPDGGAVTAGGARPAGRRARGGQDRVKTCAGPPLPPLPPTRPLHLSPPPHRPRCGRAVCRGRARRRSWPGFMAGGRERARAAGGNGSGPFAGHGPSVRAAGKPPRCNRATRLGAADCLPTRRRGPSVPARPTDSDRPPAVEAFRIIRGQAELESEDSESRSPDHEGPLDSTCQCALLKLMTRNLGPGSESASHWRDIKKYGGQSRISSSVLIQPGSESLADPSH